MIYNPDLDYSLETYYPLSILGFIAIVILALFFSRKSDVYRTTWPKARQFIQEYTQQNQISLDDLRSSLRAIPSGPIKNVEISQPKSTKTDESDSET